MRLALTAALLPTLGRVALLGQMAAHLQPQHRERAAPADQADAIELDAARLAVQRAAVVVLRSAPTRAVSMLDRAQVCGEGGSSQR